jgi:uncharacterized protein YbcV (DUF1398 family)
VLFTQDATHRYLFVDGTFQPLFLHHANHEERQEQNGFCYYAELDDKGSAMQIETIEKYQLHLIAHELSDSGRWDPFIAIFRFDEDAQDFKCVLEKAHASEETYADYNDAIDAARRIGKAFIDADKGKKLKPSL